MSKIMDHTLDYTRHRRFTSSQMQRLTGFARVKGARENDIPGSAFDTYCDELFHQRILDRSLELNPYSRPMIWGEFVESFAFEKMGLEWSLDSRKTYVHPDPDLSEWWSGRPDGISNGSERIVMDIKCPEPKAFAKMSMLFLDPNKDPLEKIEIMKKDLQMRDYYWQLVSNGILTQSDKAQLTVYLPTPLEIQDIKLGAENIDEDKIPVNRHVWDYRFIAEGSLQDLPHLPSSAKIDPLNSFLFEIPQEDKDFLTARVRKARDRVIQYGKTFGYDIE